MLQKLNSRRGGFTLVEIMIVVAIIALLASIAVPNFLRARKRSQATVALQEIRQMSSAADQWAIEKNKKDADTPTWLDLKGYIKETTALYAAGGNDSQGNAFVYKTVLLGSVALDPSTKSAFSDVTDAAFWSPY